MSDHKMTRWLVLPPELVVLARGWRPVSGLIRFGDRQMELDVWYRLPRFIDAEPSAPTEEMK